MFFHQNFLFSFPALASNCDAPACKASAVQCAVTFNIHSTVQFYIHITAFRLIRMHNDIHSLLQLVQGLPRSLNKVIDDRDVINS